MSYTVGIDIGSGAVKTVLFNDEQWLQKRVERIRRRDPFELARHSFDEVLKESNLHEKDIAYVATTGEGENVKFATGHFYS
ncbi:MAG TPA: BadF/BadG/BcrA/BcrD ATPase family protein, partial [Burkholderiales bacterium]|nr:BadF/BadG/BcrA/BcrD ATPase family protein [Burkholderiales bacterium]